MFISLANSRTDGFKKWADAHPPGRNDDDEPGGAAPVALTEPAYDVAPMTRQPHRPWVVPGAGGSF